MNNEQISTSSSPYQVICESLRACNNAYMFFLGTVVEDRSAAEREQSIAQGLALIENTKKALASIKLTAESSTTNEAALEIFSKFQSELLKACEELSAEAFQGVLTIRLLPLFGSGWKKLRELKKLHALGAGKNETFRTFFDCGSNLAQGLRAISQKLGIDKSWNVFSFEPNPHTYKLLVGELGKLPFPVKHSMVAVWNEDCQRPLTMECWPGRIELNGRHFGDDLWIGGGTNILGNDFVSPDYIDPKYIKAHEEQVTCIDFARFLAENSNETDFIAVKLDCEGAEFAVLEKLFNTGRLSQIDELYIEWHGGMCHKEQAEQFFRQELERRGIIVHTWH